MTDVIITRSRVLAAAGAVLATGASGLIRTAHAQAIMATPTVRGGANNYLPGAPIVDRLGPKSRVRKKGEGRETLWRKTPPPLPFPGSFVPFGIRAQHTAPAWLVHLRPFCRF